MSEVEATSTPETPQQPQIPKIEGNLWWDDVRQAFCLFSIGMSIFAATVLTVAFFSNFLTGLTFFVSGVLMLVGVKMFLSIPSESKGTIYALGVMGCVSAALVVYVLNYLFADLLGFDPRPQTVAALVLGVASVVPFAFFTRSVGAALKDPALEGSSWLYLFIGAVLAIATIATGMTAVFMQDVSLLIAPTLMVGLSVLLAGYTVFLAHEGYKTIVKAQTQPEIASATAAAPEVQQKTEEETPQEMAEKHEQEPSEQVPVGPPENVNEKTGEELFGDQWQGLQSDDKSAGRAVVGLMTVIFAIGVVLYLIIAIQAA